MTHLAGKLTAHGLILLMLMIAIAGCKAHGHRGGHGSHGGGYHAGGRR